MTRVQKTAAFVAPRLPRVYLPDTRSNTGCEMDYEAARKLMVDSQIRPSDVTDQRLLSVLERTPKEEFLPTESRAFAYVEKEIVLSPERALPTPRDFAKLLNALDVGPDDLVLDVACATGYSTAVLAQMCEMVVAIESDEKFAAKAEQALVAHDVGNAAVIVGDPVEGAAKQGPYDVIVIAGVVETALEALLEQLKDGGRLGALVAEDGVVRGVVHRRTGAAVSATRRFHAASRRVVKGFEKPKAFVF